MDDFSDIRLRDLRFFDRLEALGTITAAARELRIPKPTASRWLAKLEQRVGHPLVLRSTRQLALTERGQAFVARVRQILSAVDAARLEAQSDEPQGTLRASIPAPLGRMLLGPVIAIFRQRLPAVRLEISLQSDRVDLLRERFDLAIRSGPLPDSTLIVKRLAKVPLWIYLSARFAGTPLPEIPLIAAARDAQLLRGKRGHREPPAALIDDRMAIADALRGGAGFGILPAFLGEPAVNSGELLRLDDEAVAALPVQALYLPAQRHDRRIAALVEILSEQLLATVDA